eukprot:365399-Chlamydomonas_euryale.AAC.3
MLGEGRTVAAHELSNPCRSWVDASVDRSRTWTSVLVHNRQRSTGRNPEPSSTLAHTHPNASTPMRILADVCRDGQGGQEHDLAPLPLAGNAPRIPGGKRLKRGVRSGRQLATVARHATTCSAPARGHTAAGYSRQWHAMRCERKRIGGRARGVGLRATRRR